MGSGTVSSNSWMSFNALSIFSLCDCTDCSKLVTCSCSSEEANGLAAPDPGRGGSLPVNLPVSLLNRPALPVALLFRALPVALRFRDLPVALLFSNDGALESGMSRSPTCTDSTVSTVDLICTPGFARASTSKDSTVEPPNCTPGFLRTPASTSSTVALICTCAFGAFDRGPTPAFSLSTFGNESVGASHSLALTSSELSCGTSPGNAVAMHTSFETSVFLGARFA
mmetsp:Transcript_95107/g.168403  ORF Transcript_95107/g.168403 Transcript_95107/m.168403 type:complete len:226 (-) Transcript_95107:30-707(-)